MTIKTTTCAECGRTLTSTRSIANGRGAWCRSKARAAVQAEALEGRSERVATKAAELLARRRAITATGPDTYRVRGSHGAVYTVVIAPELDGKVPELCSCTAGRYEKECNHAVSVRARRRQCEHRLAA